MIAPIDSINMSALRFPLLTSLLLFACNADRLKPSEVAAAGSSGYDATPGGAGSGAGLPTPTPSDSSAPVPGAEPPPGGVLPGAASPDGGAVASLGSPDASAAPVALGTFRVQGRNLFDRCGEQ